MVAFVATPRTLSTVENRPLAGGTNRVLTVAEMLPKDVLKRFQRDSTSGNGVPAPPPGIAIDEKCETTRSSVGSPWSNLTVVSISGVASIRDQTPSISSDALTLMFNSTRTPSLGGQDIFVAARQTRNNPWTTPLAVDHKIGRAHV